jgi:predicted metal-dependent hydrolase
MNTIYVELNENRKVEVAINRKDVKNVRLKVMPDCSVSITVPMNVSAQWIETFIGKKKEWINEKIKEYNNTLGVENITQLKNGISVKLFGRNKLIDINESSVKKVYVEESSIRIDTIDSSRLNVIQKQFDDFMRKELIHVVNEKVKKYFSIIRKEGYDVPSIRIRKMKSMWGSCNPSKNNITINFYLYQAPIICIEYVVLHELLHYIHDNHSQDFYELLNLYMPDWRTRKHVLDYEVISYIK